jgi:DNA-binding GntR family transcriptional regulator
MSSQPQQLAFVPREPTPDTLADRAYFTLREHIITHRFKPGQPIQEQHLIRDLGLGRTPIREALRRLVTDHLVTVTPSRGTFVRDISVTDVALMGEIRTDLEAFAAGLAAERATAEDRESIRALQIELAGIDQVADAKTLLALYYRSHQQVYEAAQNVLLTETLDRYLVLAMRVLYQVLARLPQGLGPIVSAHREVLAAIWNGAAEPASQAAAGHVQLTQALIRDAI